jgi:hypothetical protein
MRESAQQYLGDRQPSIAELQEAARRQGFIVQLDPKAAIEVLPQLVPDTSTRRALLVAARRPTRRRRRSRAGEPHVPAANKQHYCTATPAKFCRPNGLT